MTDPTTNILSSRGRLPRRSDAYLAQAREQAAEGGCGVIGFASDVQVAGKHMLQALNQMHNRGNGKGGGIAAVGLAPEQFGVTQQILDHDYLYCVAYLDASARSQVEAQFIDPVFEIDHVRHQPALDDHTLLGLDVRPPDVVQYFVRVKADAAEAFREANELSGLTQRQLEDELVYQNTYKLHSEFYESAGETRAFVLSHGKNLLVLKMVAYGNDVVEYYQLQETRAHVWIGHHRYPTKGRVWHPGGAHPFIGLNEALVHNGDFANYASIGEYLAQRNIYPHFLTDTEVAVQVFDLLSRTYRYPLEYVIEAIAPTTERDFTLLPEDKQKIYEMLQVTHMHASPDGPWFFLIAQSETESSEPVYRLTCITDTSMLRPQVFALQQRTAEGPAIGFAASEKQAIDAALMSLSAEDDRFWRRADRYWNARGGSHTDGGAFVFSVSQTEDGKPKLLCADKFGTPVQVDVRKAPLGSSLDPKVQTGVAKPSPILEQASGPGREEIAEQVATSQYTNGKSGEDPLVQLPVYKADRLKPLLSAGDPKKLFRWVVDQLVSWSYADLGDFLTAIENQGRLALDTLTLMMDRRYPTGRLRRSSMLALVDSSLERVLRGLAGQPGFSLVAFDSRTNRIASDAIVILEAAGFPPEGPESVARLLVELNQQGNVQFIIFGCGGHRFIGSGLGRDTHGVRIDVYGSSGDYLASGIDGMDIRVHNNAQDQLSQIMKAGKLVVYGDVGQTFMYGAKGGDAYVLGNAAGRPLINAVGKPRVVINGTALDYLAESFMAGNPHKGGGFVILNGLQVDDDGRIKELETPYPGGNLFSLASGGAIFVRDPHARVSADQLNGGEFFNFSQQDWDLILPYLEENARLFGISISALLTVHGEQRTPAAVYRKIAPTQVRALQAEEIWVRKDY
jgi:glutamate synthase domain-containing protein 1/glutamate synthase domain-containing protein 3